MRKEKKNAVRSALTGRIINGREVILTEEALDYVKKMGYTVRPPMSTLFVKNVMSSIILFLSFLLIVIPAVSALPEIVTVDFSSRLNQIITIILVFLSVCLYAVKQYTWSGFLGLMLGIAMALNNVSVLFSLLIVGLSIVVIFTKQ